MKTTKGRGELWLQSRRNTGESQDQEIEINQINNDSIEILTRILLGDPIWGETNQQFNRERSKHLCGDNQQPTYPRDKLQMCDKQNPKIAVK